VLTQPISGNIAVSSSGRIFFTFHPEFSPVSTKVAESILIRDRKNSFRAFPSKTFQENFMTCLSLRIDSLNRLWVLDHAFHGIKAQPKLYAFQLLNNEGESDRYLFNYSFPKEVAGFGSFLNDFQIDQDSEYIYIADTSIVGGDPAVVVFSVSDMRSYRLLSSHSSMFGLSSSFQIENIAVKLPGPFGLRINVDSIALDRVDGSWLYYGAMTSPNLYAISTGAIREQVEMMSTAGHLPDLSAEVHLVLSDKPVTDGLTTDPMGNIYMTAVDLSAIVVAVCQSGCANGDEERPPAFAMRKLVESPEQLRWPDGLSFGPKGLYITSSALYVSLLGMNVNTSGPYHIFKIASETIQGMQPYAPYANDTFLYFSGQ
jgi:hypothetical protein